MRKVSLENEKRFDCLALGKLIARKGFLNILSGWFTAVICRLITPYSPFIYPREIILNWSLELHERLGFMIRKWFEWIMSVLVSFSARTSKLVRGGMGISQLDTSIGRPPLPPSFISYSGSRSPLTCEGKNFTFVYLVIVQLFYSSAYLYFLF